MPNRLTNDDLEAIMARCQAASRAPWSCPTPGSRFHHTVVSKGENPKSVLVAHTFLHGSLSPPAPQAHNNADFIAHARTDIPRLVHEIEALRHENAELRRLTARARAFVAATAHGNGMDPGELSSDLEDALIQGGAFMKDEHSESEESPSHRVPSSLHPHPH